MRTFFFFFFTCSFLTFLPNRVLFMDHKFHFSATFSLKMGPTILFTYLKIILLQFFSIFSFQLYPNGPLSLISSDLLKSKLDLTKYSQDLTRSPRIKAWYCQSWPDLYITLVGSGGSGFGEENCYSTRRRWVLGVETHNQLSGESIRVEIGWRTNGLVGPTGVG